MKHLAEFNIGVLRYDWDDPRLADFQNNLDRVYKIAERSAGYVWHLDPAQMEMAQLDPEGPIGGNPRAASTLSVWKDAKSLRDFTYNTVHKHFYDRKLEWYDPADQLWSGHRLVMWWVEKGHRPTVAEAADRLNALESHGQTDAAFSWDHLSPTS
ncbi:MAG: DUF3291 domain-containing protein [Paracoccaceae bacterium]